MKNCRDCKYFINPQPSILYKHESVSYDCPYQCHLISNGKTYTVGGEKVCSHFEQVEQLSIVF